MTTGPAEIVSYFPGERQQPLIPGTEHDLIEACVAELAILGTIGGDEMVIPNTHYEVLAQPGGNPKIAVRQEAIDAEPFTPGSEWPRQGESAPNQRKAYTLAEALLQYYDGVLAEQRSLFLGNIAPAEAWAVTPLGKLALLRTAPFMIGSQEPGIAVPNIKTQLAIMYDWVCNLQPRTSESNQFLRLRVYDAVSRLNEQQS